MQLEKNKAFEKERLEEFLQVGTSIVKSAKDISGDVEASITRLKTIMSEIPAEAKSHGLERTIKNLSGKIQKSEFETTLYGMEKSLKKLTGEVSVYDKKVANNIKNISDVTDRIESRIKELRGLVENGKINIDYADFSKNLEKIKKDCDKEAGYLERELKDRIEEIQNGKIDATTLDDAEKDELIRLYERFNREYGENMDDFLEPLLKAGYDDDIRNIKIIAYTAPEPYRTIYLENIKDIKIVDLDYDGTSCYTSGIGIKYNAEGINGNHYVTFFHESGHAIDDIVCNKEKLSSTYTNSNGEYLIDVLKSDVKSTVNDSIDKYIKDNNISAREAISMRREVSKKIMNCYSVQKEKMVFSSTSVENCFNEVVDDVKYNNFATSSDIYGGFTGNQLINGAGHGEFKEKAFGVLSPYWIEGHYNIFTQEFEPKYSKYGEIVYSGAQSSEFFAENFAAQMTRNEYELNGIDGHFNEAIPYMEEMLESIYNNGD